MNSDVDMIKVMVRWIETFVEVPRNELKFRLYIHRPYEHENCEEYWAINLNIDRQVIQPTIYKPSGLLVKKRPNYKGCLRLIVPKSTKLLRKMILWHHMLAREYS